PGAAMQPFSSRTRGAREGSGLTRSFEAPRASMWWRSPAGSLREDDAGEGAGSDNEVSRRIRDVGGKLSPKRYQHVRIGPKGIKVHFVCACVPCPVPPELERNTEEGCRA